jgi:hypothetical protein
MGLGGVLRVFTIYGSCWFLLSVDGLNHVLGAFTLVLGFVVEALVVAAAMKFASDGRATGNAG